MIPHVQKISMNNASSLMKENEFNLVANVKIRF